MIKNLLISKNYTVQNHSKWCNDKSSEASLHENYNEMEQIMVSSAKQNLKGLDQILIHRGYASDIREVFRIHFTEIYQVWKSDPCNILYCDLDVVFVKPAEFFNQFNLFSMFNLTDPNSTTDNHYGISFKNFYNCGIRYYPHTMSEQVWQIGFDMLANWNPNRWDSEQLIYNQMMWSQSDQISDFFRPDLAYQLVNAHDDNRNGISIDNAKVIHFHGSRGSSNKLNLMKKYDPITATM